MFNEGLSAYSQGDIATAFQLWRPLAEHGDAEAQFALASLYYDGIGVPVDHTESSYWFHLAAEQGHAEAQYNIGNAYIRGEGVRQSKAMAIHWWGKAAEQGLSEAQFNIDQAREEEAGVEKNEPAAVRLHEKSAGIMPPTDIAMSSKLDRPDRPTGKVDCEDWLANQPQNAYTIQLMSTRRPDDAHELARQHELTGYVVCSYAHEGHTRHALLLGAYTSAGAAGETAASLPAELQTGNPWVRKIKSLKQLMKNNAQ